jgi:hypothetical protein
MNNNMAQPQGMPAPMSMDMASMGQFPGGMMMPSQMGFPGQNMYMDPNINMQMMFAANAASQANQDGGQGQFTPGMMGGNQFMQMQQPFNNMMQMQAPLSIKFTTVQNMPDGSCQNIDNQLTVQQMDQSYEVTQRIKVAMDLIQKNVLNDGINELTKLSNEKKLTFSCIPMQAVENAENTQHGKWGVRLRSLPQLLVTKGCSIIG